MSTENPTFGEKHPYLKWMLIVLIVLVTFALIVLGFGLVLIWATWRVTVWGTKKIIKWGLIIGFGAVVVWGIWEVIKYAIDRDTTTTEQVSNLNEPEPIATTIPTPAVRVPRMVKRANDHYIVMGKHTVSENDENTGTITIDGQPYSYTAVGTPTTGEVEVPLTPR